MKTPATDSFLAIVENPTAKMEMLDFGKVYCMSERKEYRSAIRSRRLIHQAFLELLKEKPFEKITVTDIVNRADVNRSTFYAHYPDVRGLVEALVEKGMDDSLKIIRNADLQDIFKDPAPFLRELICVGQEYMEIYRMMGRSNFALELTEKIKASMLDKALTAEDIPIQIRGSEAFRIRAIFFIGGILNIYQQWMLGGLNCSADDITEQLVDMILGIPSRNRGWLDLEMQ